MDEYGNNALMYAIFTGDWDIARKLIDMGADVNIMNHIEDNLKVYESKFQNKQTSHLNHENLQDTLRIKNTLYLYGGDFYRRQKDIKKAFNWYTRDIYFKELPQYLIFYLTSLKTIERLLMAYTLGPLENEKTFLKELINNALVQIFQNITVYSQKILNMIQNNPQIDISQLKLNIPGKDDQSMMYAGEASRELFLIALIYNKVIMDTDYKDIRYGAFFQ